MSMDKIFEQYKKPKISYLEFKERNKIILNNVTSNIQTNKSSNVMKNKNKTILNEFNSNIQINKIKRNIKLKYSLYAIILLIVASLSIVFIVNLKSSGDIEKGIESLIPMKINLDT